MITILPITSLRDEDSLLYGSLNVLLAKLHAHGLPVAKGYVVTPPNLHLQTVIEHFDFKTQEVFEQSLILVKKELEKTPIPEVLSVTLKDKKSFLAINQEIKSVSQLWQVLLNYWLDQVKQKVWSQGFSDHLTENLEPLVVTIVDDPKSFGTAFIDSDLDDVVIDTISGKLQPVEARKLDDLIRLASKKILLPHLYKWVLDKGLKLIQVLPFNEANNLVGQTVILEGAPATDRILSRDSLASLRSLQNDNDDRAKTSVKVFLNLSTGLVVDHNTDGFFLDSSKIFDPSKSKDSFEELTFKLMETATLGKPVLFKLADKSEGMGKIRGTFRLINQNSLLNPLIESLNFAKNVKNLNNIQLVVPFVRGVSELMEIKKLLAQKNLTRKSIQHWLEIAIPENILNLEDYLLTGVDGVVLNLDELISHLNGFDPGVGELTHYKHEVGSLIKFLEEGIKLINKSGIPFIALGSLTLNPTVLDFLVEKGVYGVIVERFENDSIHELLHQKEKKLVVRKALY